jgi:hypothetical protein
MARIRTIKPDFWTDEKLTECSLSARLLFIGTWNFADDNGNLDRSAKQIKARVFPLDNLDCEPLILELLAKELLIEYSYEDRLYLHIQGFNKHQLINRPSKPTCPIYDESLRTHGVLITEGRKERKGVEVKETRIPDNFTVSERVIKWAEKNKYYNLEKHLDSFVLKAQSKGYKYIDWDSAFMNAIRDNWANIPNNNPKAPAI